MSATPFGQFQAALEAAGSRTKSRKSDDLMAQCPAHDDRTPSLHLSVDQNGRVLVKCFAGCETEAVLEALDLTWTHLYPSGTAYASRGVPRPPPIEVAYTYTDVDGSELYRIVRRPQHDGKTTFVQQHRDGPTWVNGRNGIETVPYRLHEIAARPNADVYVVEGEKDADRVASIGLLATTNPQGAMNWEAHHSTYLADRHVIILADNDDCGINHAHDVAAKIQDAAASVRIVHLPDLPPKGDVSDWLDAGNTSTDLAGLVRAATPWEPGGSVALEDKYPDLDLRALWDAGLDQPEWLIEDLVMTRRAGAVFAKGKTGKSLVLLEMAACIAAGVEFAGLSVQHRHVLYVDRENDPGDIIDRLKTMGFTPEQLDWLHYKSFPPLPSLDTDHGGRELLDLATHHNAGLVVLDTTSRLVAGGENDADTYRAYAIATGALLKAEGIATIRIDHAGADVRKGQRGSTAKNDDVDVVWQLRRRGHDVYEWTFGVWDDTRRYRHGLDQLTLERGPAGRLRQPFDTTTTTAPALSPASDTREGKLVAVMDELDLPPAWGRKRCGKALRSAGHEASNDLIDAAIKQRRERNEDIH